MRNLKLNYTWDLDGNRHTEATYLDREGVPTATRLNGHRLEAEVIASIERHRRLTSHI